MTKVLPKSMGRCADLLFEAREKRLAADKVAATLKLEETRIKNHIIDNLSKDTTGAAGKHHRVQVVRKKKFRVNPEHWENFFSWVGKNKRWDMLQKRINETAIVDYTQQPRAKPIVGLETYDYVDISLTKV